MKRDFHIFLKWNLDQVYLKELQASIKLFFYFFNGAPAKDPPSTSIVDPEIKLAASEAAKSMAAVVSETCPIRPSGYASATLCRMKSKGIPVFSKAGRQEESQSLLD